MLIEGLAVIILSASCDVTKAALGACGASCSSIQTAPGSFALCETTTTTRNNPSPLTMPSAPRPQRLCSFYANNTIDVPTLTIIQAWVEVGSRLCMGDKVPEKPIVYRPVSEQLEDIFRASVSSPRAWLVGPENPEPLEAVSFEVESAVATVAGSLSGKTASIRFRPVGFSWSFSDGANGQGRKVTHAFEQEGEVFARAQVRYEVDYQLNGIWSQSVATWSLSSNKVSLKVVDPPRRTLLIP